MKNKTTALICVILFTLLAACSKQPKSMQGTWESELESMQIQLILNADGTCAMGINGTTVPGGKWEKKGKEIIFTTDDSPDIAKMTIISKKEDEMVLQTGENGAKLTYQRTRTHESGKKK